MTNHSAERAWFSWATTTLTRANRPDRGSAVPGRQAIVRQAPAGTVLAISRTLIG